MTDAVQDRGLCCGRLVESKVQILILVYNLQYYFNRYTARMLLEDSYSNAAASSYVPSRILLSKQGYLASIFIQARPLCCWPCEHHTPGTDYIRRFWKSDASDESFRQIAYATDMDAWASLRLRLWCWVSFCFADSSGLDWRRPVSCRLVHQAGCLI